MKSYDAVRLNTDLARAKYASAREELETLIERTAMSPAIREKKDYFVAFFTERGRLISGTNFPLGAAALDAIVERFPLEGMRPGDLYSYNSPYGSSGGVSHAPDLVVIRPTFAESGELIGVVQVFGHLWDIGGIEAGSIASSAHEIYHEGVLIPPVQLAVGGKLNNGIIEILLENTRFPSMLQGDVRALIAACELGDRRLMEMAGMFGVEELVRVNEAIMEQGRSIASAGFAAIPEGRYEFIERIDAGSGDEHDSYVALALTRRKDFVSVDTRGTSDQTKLPINFLMHPSVLGMMFGMFFAANEPGVSLNGGMLDALHEVDLRAGSLLNPLRPAALGMRGITWTHTNSAVFGTLALATEGNAPAASPSYVVYYLRGYDNEREQPVYLMDGLAVGYGAKPWGDGLDAIYYSAQENFPVEFMEALWPIRVLAYGLHVDSGGPGQCRGGLGVVRKVEVLIDGLEFSSRLNNVRFPAWGCAGGREGRPGCVLLNPDTDEAQQLDPLSHAVKLAKGDVIEIRTSGGGGWGDPRTRGAQDVLADVLDGFVSVERAREDYGVAIGLIGESIDEGGTNALRAEMPSPSGMFHQDGEYSSGGWGIKIPAIRTSAVPLS